MDQLIFKPMYVKILIYKGFSPNRVVYYRNSLPFYVVVKWKWYFEYLAARIKVCNPRIKVKLIIGQQNLLQGDEYKREKIKNLIKHHNAQIKKLLSLPFDTDLFGFKAAAQRVEIEALKEKKVKLENGEFDGYIPTTYINDVKQYIK